MNIFGDGDPGDSSSGENGEGDGGLPFEEVPVVEYSDEEIQKVKAEGTAYFKQKCYQ